MVTDNEETGGVPWEDAARAYQEGHLAGRARQNRCPWPDNPDLAFAWLEGYVTGAELPPLAPETLMEAGPRVAETLRRETPPQPD
jgi:hypothetical protein